MEKCGCERMKKYYILFKERGKIPELLLNEEDEYHPEKDKVVFWLKRKNALKQLKKQRIRFPGVKYILLEEVR